MEKIIDVAQYVYKYYLKETDEKIDEMKLHLDKKTIEI